MNSGFQSNNSVQKKSQISKDDHWKKSIATIIHRKIANFVKGSQKKRKFQRIVEKQKFYQKIKKMQANIIKKSRKKKKCFANL